MRSKQQAYDSSAYDALDKWAGDLPYPAPEGPGDFWHYTGASTTVVITSTGNQTQIVSTSRVIKDVFIQGNKLSVSFLDTTRTQVSAYDTTVTVLARYAYFGTYYEGVPGAYGIDYTDVIVVANYTETVAATSDMEVDVFTLSTDGENSITKTIAFTESVVTEAYAWDDTRTYNWDNPPVPTPVTKPDTPNIKTIVNLQYADGINGVYSIFYDTRDFKPTGSTRTCETKVKGYYGVIEDLGVYTTSIVGSVWHTPLNLTMDINTTTDVSYASNAWFVVPRQGLIGAFDNKTYLMQANNADLSPFSTALAFSDKNSDAEPREVLRLAGDRQSMTLGSK
jgi:hypothetical protein